MSQIATPVAPSAAPVVPVAAPVAPVTTPDAKPALLAGKYADQAALEKGIREANTKLDFDTLPEGDLIGEGKRFKDAAAAEKFYRGLDKMIGKPAAPADAPKPGDPVAPLQLGEEPLPDNPEPKQVLERSGLKGEDLAKQWAEKGSLTDEQYAKLKSADPRLSRLSTEQAKAITNQEMRLQQAESQLRSIGQARVQAECAEVVGGADKLKALLADAPNYVPASDLAAYKKLVGDPMTAKATVRVLAQMQADHLGAGGSRPLIDGQPGTSSHGVTTIAQYKDVERRAIAGDLNAQNLLLSISRSDVQKLK